jgi:tubulin alpha
LARLYRYLLEHGLEPDGHINPNVTDEDTKSGSYEKFFIETSNGKYVPLPIFVDLDPSVRDRPQTITRDLPQLILMAYR